MAGKWWVAINTGSDSTFSGADPFGAPSGYEVFQAGSDADEKALEATAKGSTVSLHHIIWQVGGGPYKTKAEADKALPAIQAANPAPGLANQLGVPTTPFSDVAHALSAIYDKVTDGKMWRSLGWILLGVLLIIMGLALYLRKSIGGVVASTVLPGIA